MLQLTYSNHKPTIQAIVISDPHPTFNIYHPSQLVLLNRKLLESVQIQIIISAEKVRFIISLN